MQIDKDKVVSIDYTLTGATGQVLDTSKGAKPLVYLHGNGALIPGLEAALQSKSPGDSVKVTVPPEEGYGVKDPKLVQPVPRATFGAIENIIPGMQFQAQHQSGTKALVTVVAVNADSITIDANHPLAGQTLNFDVTVVDVREPTAEELAHQHAHTPESHS